MKKILYKTRKWDKEVKECAKMKSVEIQHRNMQSIIDHYLKPEIFKGTPLYDERIKDPASFYDHMGGTYFLLANKMYLLGNDTAAIIGYLYLHVKAMAKSYELERSGVTITNCAIEVAHTEKRELEQISFDAVAIGRFELFEKYAEGIGCELIKAMYHKEYDKARQLAEELPDSEEMYKANKHYDSYYYSSCYMKDLYLSILNKDEKAFNEALIKRLKNVRTGYVMPIDVVSISMIRFAKAVGLECKIDVIEIPKAFCEDDLFIDEEKYKLPEVD